MSMLLADVESIERATLAAVAPGRVEALPGWLLPMDHGTVGRAHAAVPMFHEPARIAPWREVAERYRAAACRPVFRLPELAAWAGVRAELTAAGWSRVQPTQVQVAPLAGLLGADTSACALDERPDAAWMAMFLGEGLDPVDGASRSAALARAQNSRYASLRVDGETRACGMACFAQGWLSVHGMRTAAAHRGQGLATRLLAAMAQEARAHGIERVFLQVDASNAPALSLYRRLGFAEAWTYAYWRPALI
jgi:ribosomal protein S18 acetylase RimI-like enzyme